MKSKTLKLSGNNVVIPLDPVTKEAIVPERERDIYDDAVDYLTANPHEIHPAWNYANGGLRRPGSILFREIQAECGVCLTQIRGGFEPHVAFAGDIQSQLAVIIEDARIPTSGSRIGVADLPVFAEWNRRLDRELNRPVPTSI